MEELTSILTRLRMGRYAITDLRKKIDPELRDVKKARCYPYSVSSCCTGVIAQFPYQIYLDRVIDQK